MAVKRKTKKKAITKKSTSLTNIRLISYIKEILLANAREIASGKEGAKPLGKTGYDSIAEKLCSDDYRVYVKDDNTQENSKKGGDETKNNPNGAADPKADYIGINRKTFYLCIENALEQLEYEEKIVPRNGQNRKNNGLSSGRKNRNTTVEIQLPYKEEDVKEIVSLLGYNPSYGIQRTSYERKLKLAETVFKNMPIHDEEFRNKAIDYLTHKSESEKTAASEKEQFLQYIKNEFETSVPLKKAFKLEVSPDRVSYSRREITPKAFYPILKIDSENALLKRKTETLATHFGFMETSKGNLAPYFINAKQFANMFGDDIKVSNEVPENVLLEATKLNVDLIYERTNMVKTAPGHFAREIQCPLRIEITWKPNTFLEIGEIEKKEEQEFSRDPFAFLANHKKIFSRKYLKKFLELRKVDNNLSYKIYKYQQYSISNLDIRPQTAERENEIWKVDSKNVVRLLEILCYAQEYIEAIKPGEINNLFADFEKNAKEGNYVISGSKDWFVNAMMTSGFLKFLGFYKK